MKRTSMEDQQCAVARSLDIVGDWWTLLIVRDALGGVRRFGEFQRSLGVARNLLTTRLRSLIEEGILEMAPASDGSAYQEYLLTAKGRALVPVLIALSQWSDVHVFKRGQVSLVPLDVAHMQKLNPLEIRASDGRLLNADEVHFSSGLDSQAGELP
jgi:DNA-binding HxlR family transcriptional regulator